MSNPLVEIFADNPPSILIAFGCLYIIANFGIGLLLIGLGCILQLAWLVLRR